VKKQQVDLSFSSEDSERVVAYERELVMGMQRDSQLKTQEVEALKALLVKKDQDLEAYYKLLDEKGAQLS
jgi:hypothetical protein